MSIRFDHPEFLLLGLLAIPLAYLGWRAMALTDPLRRAVSLVLRTILLLAVVLALAGPHMIREHNQLTVIGLLDISSSVQRFANLTTVGELGRSNIEYLRQWFRTATQTKAPDDRFGLVVFDGKAIAISAPTRREYVDDNLDLSIAQGTNIADAVRLGLAMFPADTAKRLVLVSDGNETAGDVLEAVRQAAGTQASGGRTGEASASQATLTNGEPGAQTQAVDVLWYGDLDVSVPIDVLPIAYNITDDVQVVRVEAPPSALPDQPVTVRIILESASSQPVSGLLTLRREELPVDLNGGEPGTSRRIEVPPGQSVHLAQVTLGQTPINRFDAEFDADDPRANALPDNDRAQAFTATPSRGSVLVLSSVAGPRATLLTEFLEQAGMPAETAPPTQLPDDLLSLQNHDLIVLDNVAAAELSSRQQDMLSKYVNDMGGGLIMVGGENSFGAGGWNGTIVEAMLPLELDPTRELRLPTAALVLVLDKSGSMNQPVAGARATQQEVANEGAALAIESLRADSMVGVVTFDTFARTVVPLQRNDNPQKLAERVRGIAAEGGTNLEPGLQMAFSMLRDQNVAKKRVVCMSDGRSQSTEDLPALAKRMADAGVQVSAIAVGDDADHETMRKIAESGGGEFYAVRDPRTLPRVLVESVQIINKPLLKETPFQPRVLPTGSTLTAGMEAAPQLGGLVITSPKDDPKVAVEMLHPDGEPLLAHWQAGLGRVAAFTSESPGAGPWSQQWADWPGAATFWVQLARTIARPAMSRDAELTAIIQNNRLNLTYEIASSADPSQAGSMDYLQVAGSIYTPDGGVMPVRLRQTGPGRYETSVEANLAGNYIVALNPRQGTRQLAPVIGGASQSSSPEFRRFKSNLALLEEIVETTNGRRLSIEDPNAAPLFDRSGMASSVSFMPIWRTILLWSLALLLLDVACRRIAWDYNLLRSYVNRAIARMTPSSVRGREVAATLATLRRVSDEADDRRAAASSGLTKLQGTGRVAPPPERDEAPLTAGDEPQKVKSTPGAARSPLQPTEPEPSKVSAALDALLGRSKPAAPPPPPATISQDQATASETTSNLLAAKRRAREQLGRSGEQ